MPLTYKIVVVGATSLLIGGAIGLMALNGGAVLLDLATSAAAFICL